MQSNVYGVKSLRCNFRRNTNNFGIVDPDKDEDIIFHASEVEQYQNYVCVEINGRMSLSVKQELYMSLQSFSCNSHVIDLKLPNQFIMHLVVVDSRMAADIDPKLMNLLVDLFAASGENACTMLMEINSPVTITCLASKHCIVRSSAIVFEYGTLVKGQFDSWWENWNQRSSLQVDLEPLTDSLRIKPESDDTVSIYMQQERPGFLKKLLRNHVLGQSIT